MDIRQKLMAMADSKYRDFSKKLNPSANEILGVRVPDIRKIAKQIAKGDYISYLENDQPIYCEERQLYGLVINNIKDSFDIKLKYFDKWLNYVDSWAVCDIGVLKSAKFSEQDANKFWDYLNAKLSSTNQPYIIRAIIVCMFEYISTNKIHEVAEIYLNITDEHYYVKMAIAWGISIIAVKNFDLAVTMLSNEQLSIWIKKKAIQKCRESFRISDEQKSILKTLL